MKRIHYLSVLLASILCGLLAVPIVWMGALLIPLIALFLVLGAAMAIPLICFFPRYFSFSKKEPRVLLIANEYGMADQLLEHVDWKWRVQQVFSSYCGIGHLLDGSNYDLVLIRWNRRQLAGEEFLDHLDAAIQLRVCRRGETTNPPLPPIVFLRKTNAPPYKLNRGHLARVVGCIDIGDESLPRELHTLMH